MLRALSLSIGQLGDPPVLRVLVRTLLLTLAIFVSGGAALWWLIDAMLTRWVADLGGLAALAATVMMLLAGWLWFRAVAIAVLGLFGDDVVAAVERRHYPAALAAARPPRWHRALAMSGASVARAILVNLLALPLYILLLATGIGTPIAFAIVNGWLLGRDLSEMVAARHMPRAAIRPWLAGTRGQRMVMGLVVTGLVMVPVVNLLAPVLGAAMATHLFHRRFRA